MLDPSRVPAHIAIIMDGNGRWAAARSLPRADGHRAGVDAARRVFRACRDLGVRVLSLYAFSTENWRRPSDEVAALMHLLATSVREEAAELIRDGVQLRVSGDLSLLDADVREDVERVVELTSQNDGFILNVAYSYGGRAEILHAARRTATLVAAGELTPQQITEDVFAGHLYTAGLPDPDLLIRTGGEQRVSNFLLWQIAYTELYFTTVLWPDFDRPHLLEAIADYQQRRRRFGGVEGTQVERALADRFRRAALGPRTLTAVVGIPLLFAGLWAGGAWWIVLTALVAVLGAREFARIHPLRPPSYAAMLLLIIVVFTGIIAGAGSIVTAAVGVWAVVIARAGGRHFFPRRIDPTSPAPYLPTWFLGSAYLAVPMALLARWRLMSTPWSVLAFLLVIWVNDTAAYVVGIGAGRHKMAPQISPGKSWEGAAAGTLAGGLAALLASPLLGVSPARALAFGVFVTIASQIGDLLESAMKRKAGVKDSGAILPGHGGILDRFDGILVAAPIAYALVRLWATPP